MVPGPVRSAQADRRILEALEFAGAESDGIGGRSRSSDPTASPASISTRPIAPISFLPWLPSPAIAMDAAGSPARDAFGTRKATGPNPSLRNSRAGRPDRLGPGLPGDRGGRPLAGVIDAHNDHRIAMAGAVAGLGAGGGVGIRGSGLRVEVLSRVLRRSQIPRRRNHMNTLGLSSGSRSSANPTAIPWGS